MLLDASPLVARDSIDRVKAAVALACRTPIEGLRADTAPADVKGWDSFGRLQVILELERSIGRELPLEEAMAANTIHALAALLEERTSP